MKKNCKRFLAVLLIILSLCFFTKVSTFAEETRESIKEINLIADWFKNPEAYGEIPKGNFRFESEANGISAIMTWQEFTDKNWKDVKSNIKKFDKDKKYRLKIILKCSSNEYYISKDTKVKMNIEEFFEHETSNDSYYCIPGYSKREFFTKEFVAKDNREKIDKINISCKEFSPPVIGDPLKTDYNFLLSDQDKERGLEVQNYFWYKYNKSTNSWNTCTDQVFQEEMYKLEFTVRCTSDNHVLSEETQVILNGKECNGSLTSSVGKDNLNSVKVFQTEEFKARKLIDMPSVNTGLVYNGKIQKGVNEDVKYVFLTENEKINAGKYKTLVKPSDEYAWIDNHKIEERYLEWEIEKADPTYAIPENLTGNLGDKLSDVKLPKGFSWKDGEISLDSLGEKFFEGKYLSDNPNEKEIDHINIRVCVKERKRPKQVIEKGQFYKHFSIISQSVKNKKANKEEKRNVLKELVLELNSKKFLINGQEKLNDTSPIILNNRTMVPIRFIGESLGAKIEWDQKNSLVRIKDQEEKVTIEIKIGESLARVNGKEVKLTNPIFIKNNRSYGPLRFIGESLGAKVEWLKDDKKIVITK